MQINNTQREQIIKAMNQVDPMDLLAIGCPEDEYEHEVDLIIEAISPDSSDEDILTIIESTFQQQFEKVPDRIKIVELQTAIRSIIR